jgi:hypothetical protein
MPRETTDMPGCCLILSLLCYKVYYEDCSSCYCPSQVTNPSHVHDEANRRLHLKSACSSVIKSEWFIFRAVTKYTSRFWRVLTMVYNTQDYWFFWTFPSSGILETKKPQVKGGNKTPTRLGPLERANLNPVFETSCFLVSRIPDDGEVQKTH